MRGEHRRDHLLDEAARVLVEHGGAALTMERLAESAGVSKALPYKHFDNVQHVLVTLYQRETSALGRAIWRALAAAGPDDDLVRISVRTYFDELATRGRVLAALSPPGAAVRALADPDGAGVRFSVEVLQRFHGLDRARAKVVAGMVQGAIAGAADTWLRRAARRRDLEDALAAMLRTAITG